MSADNRVKYDLEVRRLAAGMFGRGLGRASVARELGVPEETVVSARRN